MTVRFASLCLVSGLLATAPLSAADKVSYYEQIRPIFQAHCQGCHQPARANGEYVMTDFAKLVKGGESESAAVVPGKPDESNLIELITPTDGAAEMPKGKKPLSKVEIELVRQWITEGAADDTPENAKQQFDKDHPPVYTRPPVITSIDVSPDGALLAVAGFHEVLLTKADGSGLVARLIGMSERIESVQFSPDGKLLAVTGGLPGRMGEVQVWDVAERELKLSVPVTYDTIYGGSWSPDGKLISFGCSDFTVRAINAETGKQVLYQGAHSDWVRDTVFTVESDHLISVSRDMTVKLTEVATERFIDNITSITPKALKGGVSSVTRHPQRNEIIVGGADGVPKIYRTFRITARRIGDDANLIRQLTPMTGRVFGVAVSRDGKRIAAVSSLDGKGELSVHSYEFDTSLPADIKAINEKVSRQRSAAEQTKLDAYRTKDIKQIAKLSFDTTPLYSVVFSPEAKTVIAAGGDGLIRLIETATGKVTKQFPVVQIAANQQAASERKLVVRDDEPATTEKLPDGAKVTAVTVSPDAIQLTNRFETAQLLISTHLESGEVVDGTRLAKLELSAPVVDLSKSGYVRAKADGEATLKVIVADKTVEIPVKVSGIAAPFNADFVRDVNPVLSRIGCNAGTCHGSRAGKNGFKLSLRGYDPIYDVRALTDDMASRRVNISSPDDSLMLMKATGGVPHVGTQLFVPGEAYYELIRSWIANGAKLDTSTARVTGIEIFPKNPVIQQLNGRQQMRIVATYADGKQKDVTREAYIESGLTDVAESDRYGLLTALRRGEAPVLARFEGAYVATTLTVMGDRSGFVWKEPASWGPIDKFTAAKWQRMRIEPSGVCTDAEFIRRVYLDLTGLPPKSDEVRKFLADKRETQTKRNELVERLIGNEDFVEYWTNKWADLLQVNRKFLGPEGAAAFRDWIRNEVASNTPYDIFAKKILTASGSNKANPAASYYKVLRNPDAIMENTTHLFLAVRFNCNKCHDHPFERWTQDQYYQTTAFFAQVGLKADPASGKRKIGGTAVEGAKPFYEEVFDKKAGETTHLRTGEVAAPEFPYDCGYVIQPNANRREQLAAWITSPDNQYFARSYVNRLWGYLFGIGIVEPIDDIRAGNPPTNPELLDYLTMQFIDSGFNVRHVLGLICKSRTYQLSLQTNKWNADDAINYSHAIARRLPAEVLFDSIHRVVGAKTKIPGVPEGTRAAAIPDAGIKLPDGFLANLGRPPRESACECERSSGLQLGPVMALISGKTVNDAIGDKDNEISKLVAAESDDRKLIDELFMRVMNRSATELEIKSTIDVMNEIDSDHATLTKALNDRDAFWKITKPKLEKQREEAIVKANADLAAYQKQIAPKIAEEEKKRQERIAKAEAELKALQAELPKQIAAFAKQNNNDIEWRFLEPASFTTSNGAKIARLQDRSLRVTGNAKRGNYQIVVNTKLRGITGFRLEALPDASIKGNGPGLSPNGNFVVTEFEVQAAPKADPKKNAKVALQNAKSDFDQATFSAAQAIDGNPGDQRGWAIANAGGVVHWATFECKKPIDFEGGTTLRIIIHQNHVAPKHRLGRFRISVTSDKAPIGLGLPEQLKSIVAVADNQRNDKQKQALTAYFQKSHRPLVDKLTAVAVAKTPVPEDPGVTKRKKTIEYVTKPVPEDSILVRLRADVEFSTKQVENKRLTTAQDLAWALINNPAFLFNR